MKHVIIGTAGHVDHGKTCLIKALTGIDTDRLKEEKKRGITIELGFAYLDFPDGQRVGMIDVPGHEKFVRNMLAGAGGMDLVMLVIAADEGIMPQTVEHLDILSILGIEKVVIEADDTTLFAFSFDGGETWKAYIEGMWVTLSEVTSGINRETVEAIGTDAWNEACTDKQYKIRFTLLEGGYVNRIIVHYLN